MSALDICSPPSKSHIGHQTVYGPFRVMVGGFRALKSVFTVCSCVNRGCGPLLSSFDNCPPPPNINYPGFWVGGGGILLIIRGFFVIVFFFLPWCASINNDLNFNSQRPPLSSYLPLYVGTSTFGTMYLFILVLL